MRNQCHSEEQIYRDTVKRYSDIKNQISNAERELNSLYQSVKRINTETQKLMGKQLAVELATNNPIADGAKTVYKIGKKIISGAANNAAKNKFERELDNLGTELSGTNSQISNTKSNLANLQNQLNTVERQMQQAQEKLNKCRQI